MKRIKRDGLVRQFHQASWNEPIIFELSQAGERGIRVPAAEDEVQATVGEVNQLIPLHMQRKHLNLPEINQKRVLTHYLRLSQETLGGDLNPEIGQGTCTVKYNPTINDKLAGVPELAGLHPLQNPETAQGILEIIYRTDLMMREISGMNAFSFQPGGGSQATMTMASIVRMYHRLRGEEEQRDEVITTLFSHPSDAAAPALKGYRIIHIPQNEDGLPDYEAFRAAVGPKTAAFVVANPEDTGLYNPRVAEFTKLVHDAGGLNCYDQANANGLFGVARAREAGFDMCYFNLHKSFGAPHGCGGPGCGAIGVTEALRDYLPVPLVVKNETGDYVLDEDLPHSIGKVRSFYGTPQVILKSYAWMMSFGADGLYEVAKVAALNNSYLQHKLLKDPDIDLPFNPSLQRVEQVRYTVSKLTERTGFSSGDISNRMMDFGLHIWSSHHPYYVPNPLTLEPTESPSRADLDEYAATLRHVIRECYENPELIRTAPHRSTIHQVDESSLDDPDLWCPTWRVYLRKTADKE